MCQAAPIASAVRCKSKSKQNNNRRNSIWYSVRTSVCFSGYLPPYCGKRTSDNDTKYDLLSFGSLCCHNDTRLGLCMCVCVWVHSTFSRIARIVKQFRIAYANDRRNLVDCIGVCSTGTSHSFISSSPFLSFAPRTYGRIESHIHTDDARTNELTRTQRRRRKAKRERKTQQKNCCSSGMSFDSLVS